MSTVWDKLINASLKMQNELEELSLSKHIHNFPWPAISAVAKLSKSVTSTFFRYSLKN